MRHENKNVRRVNKNSCKRDGTSSIQILMLVAISRSPLGIDANNNNMKTKSTLSIWRKMLLKIVFPL